jgi:hypothetical protein
MSKDTPREALAALDDMIQWTAAFAMGANSHPLVMESTRMKRARAALAAGRAAIADVPAVPDDRKLLEQALRRAFDLGQTYWRQADSDSYKQNALSDETRAKFDTLVSETLRVRLGATT